MRTQELFDICAQQYNHIRHTRHQLMEIAHMGKYENGYYQTEIEAVQFAYELLGFHEEIKDVNGETHILVPEDGDEEFAIRTEDFITLMKNSSDDELRNCMWDALKEHDVSAMQDLEDWFA